MTGLRYDPRRNRVATAFVILMLTLSIIPFSQAAPAAAQDTATYSLTKYDCNPGYDPSSGDPNAAFSNCATPSSGVSFTLQSGDQSYSGGTQQTDGNGSTSWSGIPLGSGYSISESIPNGYGNPWVYCKVTGNPNNSGDTQESFFQASGGNMDVGYSDSSLTAYTQATCYWFNVPPNQQNGNQGYGGTGTSIVHIQKLACAPDYDPSSSTYANYQSDCVKLHVGVPFTVNNSNPKQTGNNDGIVEFGSLPAGQTDIRLLEPSGYVPIAIFCVDYENGQNAQAPTLNDNNKVNWTDEGNSTYKISWNLAENHTYYCYWYDIPSGSGTLYIYKFYCAPDYDWQSGGYNDLIAGCTSPQPDVQFDVSSGNYASSQTTDNNGTATWTDVPEGNLQIQEQPPSGYQTGRIFCGYSPTQGSPPTSWDEYSYSGGWDVSTQSGQYLYCVVFDFPSSYGTVHIYKYYCAPDFDWQSNGYDYLLSGCTNWQPDVYFEIHNGSYSQGQTTDSNGAATWTQVPQGDLQITEQAPSGYAVGRIFCGVVGQNDSTLPTSWDEYDYQDGWNVQLPAGQYLHCYVFDIPSDYGTVYIYKFYCAPDFDWQSNGFDYLLSGCIEPQSDVYFEIHNGSYSQGNTTDNTGVALWDNVPAGSLEVVEQSPPGYTVGRVFCGYSPDGSTLPSSWDEYPYNQGIGVDLQAGQYLLCVYFNIPSTHGTVHFYKYYCDPAFDWQSNGYDYLLSGCTNPQEGVQFDLTSGSYASSQTTDSGGTANWADAPQGDLNFVEKLPEDYQVGRIFCGYSDTDGTPPTSWDEYTYSSGGWTVPNPSGQYVYCYIFDIPVAYGGVYIYKYYCPPDYDWQNGGAADLASGCTSPHAGVPIEVSGANYQQSQTTATDGYAQWDNVPEGDYNLVVDEPDGYQVGRIFCGYSDQGRTKLDSGDEYTYQNGVQIHVDPGTYLYCNIYDIPTTYGTVYLYKYYCDANFDWQSNGYDYLLSGCTNPHADVQFDLTSGSYAQSQTTDSSGFATWADSPYGDLHFTEQFPDGYKAGRIFCGFSDTEGTPPTSWDEYSYSDGWDVSYPEGQYLYCYIFDVPYTYGTVVFYKYYCAPDFDWQSNGYDYLLSSCTNPHADVEFSLDGDNYSESQTTDSSGFATWTDVPYGDLHFKEQFPDGYKIGRIFCGLSDTEGTPPTSWDEYFDSSGWDVTYPEGTYLYCYVFDVPYTYGTVYFYKYYCDPNFDWQSNGYDYLLSSCTNPHEGVDFDLESGSYFETQTTDSNGYATWSDVPQSDLHFVEYFPDGYQVGRIFCGYSDTDGTAPTAWDEYFYSDGWDVPFQDGKYLYCYVFDVPYENWTVYLYKYYCNADFDWQSNGYDYLLSSCTNPHEDVDFDLESGSYFETQTTDSSGYATWEDVPSGNWHFTEQIPDGYQVGRIFCGYSDTDGTPPSSWDEYDYSGGWDVTYPSGKYLYCYIFDVPQEYGWVTIYKYTCPPDFDYSSADQSSYESECTERPDGIDFELSNPGYGYQEDQTTDSSGTAKWSDVPSGSGLSIYELPNGLAPVAVWCGTSSDGSDPTSWDQYTLAADGGLGGLTLDPKTYFFCKWFNKPYDNPQVWIYKYNCEQSADWHWNYHQLLSGCTTPASGVEFAFGQQNGASSDSTTDDQGKGHWEDLTPGTWSWEESFPSGYDGAVVYCQWVNSYGSGEYQQAQLDGAKLWLTLDPGDVVTCYWFDFPTGYGPPVVAPTSGDSGGSGGTGGTGGSGGSGNTGGTGGSGGTGGTGGAGGTGGTGGTGGPPPLTSNVPKGPTGGTTGTGTGGGTTNQPSTPNAPATLIIVKRTCPDGYDIYGKDADVEKDCKDLTKDIDYALTDLSKPDAQSVGQTTGDDGKATWSNLKEGPYLIVETLPDETHAAFIWTCKSDKRQFQIQYPFTPFSYAGPDGEIGITLIGGEKLECSWYDIPVAAATVTILKFECPGSPVIVAQCDPAGAGVQFQLAPAEGVGALIQLTTAGSGSATGEGAAGAYTVTEQGGTPCLIDSEAIDDQGHLVLAEGKTAEVKIYNCGGGS